MGYPVPSKHLLFKLQRLSFFAKPIHAPENLFIRLSHHTGTLLSLNRGLQDAVLANQSAGGMRAVFAPKAGAMATLAPRLATHALGQVAVFSSVAGLLGSSGQANYAAANATLDAMDLIMQSQVGKICFFRLEPCQVQSLSRASLITGMGMGASI
jgi:hypothetical protein